MSSRREFLKRSALSAGGLWLSPLGVGCAGVPVAEGGDPERDRVVLGMHRATSLESPEDAVLRTLEHVDMSWLAPGDSVFVKLACNSGFTHPAVTSPVAVRAMCRALLERGAGRVLVGDQSGVMSVRLCAGERRHSSTRELMAGNGLLNAIEEGGGEPFFFDDQGFDDGYVEATLPAGFMSWRRRPFIARVVTEVSHIVYLPRISSHVLTGYTHGHKLAVGWLRDDSRHAMHNDGDKLYEQYVEVNYCEEIRSRLRLVVTYAEELMLDGGPDNGGIAVADPRIVLASTHLANHDAVSVGVLTWAQRTMFRERWTGGPHHGPHASLANFGLLALVEPTTGIPWTSPGAGLPSAYFAHDYGAGIDSDRSLTRAYQLLGGAPRSIAITPVGEDPPRSLKEHLSSTLPIDA